MFRPGFPIAEADEDPIVDVDATAARHGAVVGCELLNADADAGWVMVVDDDTIHRCWTFVHHDRARNYDAQHVEVADAVDVVVYAAHVAADTAAEVAAAVVD